MRIKTTPFGSNPFKRGVAVMTAALFLLTQLASYVPVAFAQSSNNIQVPGGNPSGLLRLARDREIRIPPELGLIDESFQGTSGKTILYIQDAHDSLEAQENISKIIEHLVSTQGVKTVLEEGYEGPVPTDEYFGFIKDSELKRKVAYFFLDHLRVGGAEYAHINRTKDFKLIGADSIKLHRANIDQYRLSSEKREAITQDLKALGTEVQILANKRFSKELLEWLKLKERFDTKKIDLLDYLGRTMKLLAQRNALSGDRLALLRFLLEARSSNDPNVMEKVRHIDAREVYAELIKLEEAMGEVYLKDATDKELFGYCKILGLLKRLNDLQVTQEEYEAVKTTLKTFNTESLGLFIHKNTRKPLVLSRQWERNVQDAVRFYEIAKSRDHVMETQLDSFINNPAESTAVLVFGGFHKEGVKRILEAKNISYVVVTPRITRPSPRHEEFYKRLMTNGRLSYELPANLSTATRAESRILVWNGNIPLARTEIGIMTSVIRDMPNADSQSLGLAVEQAMNAFKLGIRANRPERIPQEEPQKVPMPERVPAPKPLPTPSKPLPIPSKPVPRPLEPAKTLATYRSELRIKRNPIATEENLGAELETAMRPWENFDLDKMALQALPYYLKQNKAAFTDTNFAKVLNGLRDSGPYVRGAALQALPYFIQANKAYATELNLGKVLDALRDPNSYVREVGLLALTYFIQANKAYATELNLGKVLDALKDQAVPPRAAALKALTYFIRANKAYATDRNLGKVLDAFRDQAWSPRDAALKALPYFIRANKASFTDKNLGKVLAAIRDPDSHVRKSALQSLPYFIQANKAYGTEQNLGKVLAAISDPDSDVRESALQSLPYYIQANKAFGTEQNLGKVLAAIRDPDSDVRESALQSLPYYIQANKASFTDTNLGKVLDALSDKDSDVRQAALEALPYFTSIHPEFGPLLNQARDTIRQVFREHFGFIQAVDGGSIERVEDLVTLGAKTDINQRDDYKIWNGSSHWDVGDLAQWLIEVRNSDKTQEVQISLGWDTGIGPQFLEDEGKFIALYLWIAGVSFENFRILELRPARDTGADFGLLIRGDNVSQAHPGQQKGRRLDFIFNLSNEMTEKSVELFLKQIRTFSLGMLLANVEENWKRLFPGEIPEFMKKDPRLETLAESYRRFRERMVEFLREYNRYDDPETLLRLNSEGKVLDGFSERVAARMGGERTEEVLYPTNRWLVPLYSGAPYWDRLLPKLRKLEALALDRGASHDTPDAEGNVRTVGRKFVQDMRMIGYAALEEMQDIWAGRKTLEPRKGTWDPFLAVGTDEDKKAYLKTVLAGIKSGETCEAHLPDPVAFEKALKFYQIEPLRRSEMRERYWEEMDRANTLWTPEQIAKAGKYAFSRLGSGIVAHGVSLVAFLYDYPEIQKMMNPVIEGLKKTEAFRNGKIHLIAHYHHTFYNWINNRPTSESEQVGRIFSEKQDKLANDLAMLSPLELQVAGIDVNRKNGKIFLDFGAPSDGYMRFWESVDAEDGQWGRPDRLSVAFAVVTKELTREEKEELKQWLTSWKVFEGKSDVMINSVSLVHHLDNEQNKIRQRADFSLRSEMRLPVSSKQAEWMKPVSERMSMEKISALSALARLRLFQIWSKVPGPLSGALSVVEMYMVLYANIVRLELLDQQQPGRLRIIPKTTSAFALYAVAGCVGLIAPEKFVAPNANYFPPILSREKPFVDASSHNLGLSFEEGIGMALAGKYKGTDSPVLVFLGDGALQEGVDHPAKFAAAMKLNNLALVIDVNGIQSAYEVSNVDPTFEQDVQGRLERQKRLWNAYGWEVLEIDGHDLSQIQTAFGRIGRGKQPLVIFARTVKGKGIPLVEGQSRYSHKIPDPRDREAAKKFLEAAAEKALRFSNLSHRGVDLLRKKVPADVAAPLPVSLVLPKIQPVDGQYLHETLRRWLEQMIALNPKQIVTLNTDNPVPFDMNTPVYASGKPSPHFFLGINERFALNVARGISNEGLFPIYVTPSAHMMLNAENWRYAIMDRQPILLIGNFPGSSLSHWGPGHLAYQDIDMFRFPGGNVYQPGTHQDLLIILEELYGNIAKNLPAYIRLSEITNDGVSPELYQGQGKRKKIFREGFYTVRSNVGRSDPERPYVLLVASGELLQENIKAADELERLGLPYKLINVINLSGVTQESFRDAAKGAGLIVSSIDAQPSSLSRIIYETGLGGASCPVVGLGVTDAGTYDPIPKVYERHGMDAASLVKRVKNFYQKKKNSRAHREGVRIEPLRRSEMRGTAKVSLSSDTPNIKRDPAVKDLSDEIESKLGIDTHGKLTEFIGRMLGVIPTIHDFDSFVLSQRDPLNTLIQQYGVYLDNEEVEQILIRLLRWSFNLGFIDIDQLGWFNELNLDHPTIVITTRAQGGLGDITKIDLIIRGMKREFEKLKVSGAKFRVLIFDDDKEKMAILKNREYPDVDFIFLPSSEPIPENSSHLKDADVFVSLDRAVTDEVSFDSKDEGHLPSALVYTTLGQYDRPAPRNPRYKRVKTSEILTGFQQDSVGFLISPFYEELYQRGLKLTEEQELAEKKHLLAQVIREILPTQEVRPDQLDQAARSNWGLLYMHEQGMDYLNGIAEYHRTHEPDQSVTLFTFLGETNVWYKGTKEWEGLVAKIRAAGLPVEIYDLRHDPKAIKSIDFKKPVVRLINVGMHTLDLYVHLMAASDLPVGVTGNESLFTALLLRKRFAYEVASWERTLFSNMLSDMKNVLGEGSVAASSVGGIRAGDISARNAAKFWGGDPGLMEEFKRFGDSVAGRELYPQVVRKILRSSAFIRFLDKREKRTDRAMASKSHVQAVARHAGLEVNGLGEYFPSFDLFRKASDHESGIIARVKEILNNHFSPQELKQNGDFLDVGASDGVITEALMPYFKRGVAVEIDEHVSERLRSKEIHGLDVVTAPIQEYAPDHKFDVILVSHSLYYIEEKDRMDQIKRMASWLKPGGKLILLYTVHGDSQKDLSRMKKALGVPSQPIDGRAIKDSLTSEGFEASFEILESAVTADLDGMLKIVPFVLKKSSLQAATIKSQIQEYIERNLWDEAQHNYRLNIPQELLIINSRRGSHNKNVLDGPKSDRRSEMREKEHVALYSFGSMGAIFADLNVPLRYSAYKYGSQEQSDHFLAMLEAEILKKFGDQIRSNPAQWVLATTGYSLSKPSIVPLARKLSAQLGIEYVSVRAVRKNRKSGKPLIYSELKTQEQREAVQEMYEYCLESDRSYEGKNVIFIDDFFASGSALKKINTVLANKYQMRIAGNFVIISIASIETKDPAIEEAINSSLIRSRPLEEVAALLNRKDTTVTRYAVAALFQMEMPRFRELVALLDDFYLSKLFIAVMQNYRDAVDPEKMKILNDRIRASSLNLETLISHLKQQSGGLVLGEPVNAVPRVAPQPRELREQEIERKEGLIKAVRESELPGMIMFGDRHGDEQDLKRIVAQAEDFIEKNRGGNKKLEIIGIGDGFDEGVHNVEVFQLMKRLKQLEVENPGLIEVHLLWGNHDVMLMQANVPFADEEAQKLWLKNGGSQVKDEFFKAHIDMQEVLRFMVENFELFHIDKWGMMHVHAGIPVQEDGVPAIDRARLEGMKDEMNELRAMLKSDPRGFFQNPDPRKRLDNFFNRKDVRKILWARQKDWLIHFEEPPVIDIDRENKEKVFRIMEESYKDMVKANKANYRPDDEIRRFNEREWEEYLIQHEDELKRDFGVKARIVKGKVIKARLDRFLNELGINGIIFGHIHYFKNIDNRVWGIDVNGQEAGHFQMSVEEGVQFDSLKEDKRRTVVSIDAFLNRLIEDINAAREEIESETLISHLKQQSGGLVLLGGSSGAGKTALADSLKAALGSPVLPIDFYPSDQGATKYGIKSHELFISHNNDLVWAHISQLLQGKAVSVTSPYYYTHQFTRIINPPLKQPLIVDGLHAVNPDFIKGLPAVPIAKVFIDASRQIRFMRRLLTSSGDADYPAALMMWRNVIEAEEEAMDLWRNNADFILVEPVDAAEIQSLAKATAAIRASLRDHLADVDERHDSRIVLKAILDDVESFIEERGTDHVLNKRLQDGAASIRSKRKGLKVGIVGSSKPSQEYVVADGEKLGRLMADYLRPIQGVAFTGGDSGVGTDFYRGYYSFETSKNAFFALLPTGFRPNEEYERISSNNLDIERLGERFSVRNIGMAMVGDVFIAMNGSSGTMQEVSEVLKRGKPIIALDYGGVGTILYQTKISGKIPQVLRDSGIDEGALKFIILGDINNISQALDRARDLASGPNSSSGLLSNIERRANQAAADMERDATPEDQRLIREIRDRIQEELQKLKLRADRGSFLVGNLEDLLRGQGNLMEGLRKAPPVFVEFPGTLDPPHLVHIQRMLETLVRVSDTAEPRTYYAAFSPIGDRFSGDGESGDSWKPNKSLFEHRYQMTKLISEIFSPLLSAVDVSRDSTQNKGVIDMLTPVLAPDIKPLAIFYTVTGADNLEHLETYIAKDLSAVPPGIRKYFAMLDDHDHHDVIARLSSAYPDNVIVVDTHTNSNGARSTEIRTKKRFGVLPVPMQKYIHEKSLYDAVAQEMKSQNRTDLPVPQEGAQSRSEIRSSNLNTPSLKITAPAVVVIEKGQLEAMSRAELRQFMGFATINRAELRLVVPDMPEGRESRFLADLRKLGVRVSLDLPGVDANIRVIGFSDKERDTADQFRNRLSRRSSRLAGGVKECFALEGGEGIFLALLVARPEDLSVKNGFRYDKSGRYQAELRAVLQNLMTSYFVISSAA